MAAPVSTATDGEVHQFLTAALSYRGPAALPYADDSRWHIHHHLTALSGAFPSFRPNAGPFTHNDGRTVMLLRTEGTIPIYASGAVRYYLFFSLWLMEDYPRLPPAVFLSFPRGAVLKQHHPLVDPSGAVSVPYLGSWLFPYYNLVDLVRSLSHLFSQNPPFGQDNAPNANHDAKTREMNKVLKAVELDLKTLNQRHEVEMDDLVMRQSELKRKQEEIAGGLRELEEEKNGLEMQLQLVLMNTDVTKSWLVKNKEKARSTSRFINVDDVIVPSDSCSRQMVECVAADMAIEDTLYALGVAVREGCVPFDAYLKKVRVLSREQFFHRFAAAKIQAFRMGT